MTDLDAQIRAQELPAAAPAATPIKSLLCPACLLPLDGCAAIEKLAEHHDCRNRRERAEAVRQAQAVRLAETAPTTDHADLENAR